MKHIILSVQDDYRRRWLLELFLIPSKTPPFLSFYSFTKSIPFCLHFHIRFCTIGSSFYATSYFFVTFRQIGLSLSPYTKKIGTET